MRLGDGCATANHHRHPLGAKSTEEAYGDSSPSPPAEINVGSGSRTADMLRHVDFVCCALVKFIFLQRVARELGHGSLLSVELRIIEKLLFCQTMAYIVACQRRNRFNGALKAPGHSLSSRSSSLTLSSRGWDQGL